MMWFAAFLLIYSALAILALTQKVHAVKLLVKEINFLTKRILLTFAFTLLVIAFCLLIVNSSASLAIINWLGIFGVTGCLVSFLLSYQTKLYISYLVGSFVAAIFIIFYQFILSRFFFLTF